MGVAATLPELSEWTLIVCLLDHYGMMESVLFSLYPISFII